MSEEPKRWEKVTLPPSQPWIPVSLAPDWVGELSYAKFVTCHVYDAGQEICVPARP